MLVVLQSVLGIDNLLYIALESKRAPLDKQSYVRKIGITIAVLLRIVLLFVLVQMIAYFQEVLFEFETLVISGKFNLHSLIVLVGGIFIIYTSTSEIIHMLTLEKVNHKNNNLKSVNSVIFSIVLMNLVFSFDSILAAIALTDSLVLMIIAILTGGLIMIKMANGVTDFLKKNRMFEVLGLFILFIVGIMLLTEGAHLAHIYVFKNPILPMSKTTFYFTIFILIIIDIIQLRYQKTLVRKK
tara:strand:- start:157 stop:879 length:723 start_codon:yes stop_codon:yes gene_type:complete